MEKAGLRAIIFHSHFDILNIIISIFKNDFVLGRLSIFLIIKISFI